MKEFFSLFDKGQKIQKTSQLDIYIVSCRGVAQLGGSSTGLFPVGPTKVEACKSILFSEGSPEVKISKLIYKVIIIQLIKPYSYSV